MVNKIYKIIQYNFLVVFSLIAYKGFSQISDFSLTPNYSHFLVNSSAFSNVFEKDYKLKINTFHQSNLGIFSDLRQTYLDLSYQHQKKSIFTLKLLNNQQTSIVNQNKFLGGYALQKMLNRDLSMSIGVNLGIANIIYTQTDASLGGSSNDFDASILYAATFKNWYLGVSYNQIFGLQLKPVNYVFELKPFTQLLAMKKTELSPFTTMRNGILWQKSSDLYTLKLDNQFDFNRKTALYFSLDPLTFSALSIGAQYNLKLSKQLLGLTLSYQFLNQNQLVNSQKININLNFQFLETKKDK